MSFIFQLLPEQIECKTFDMQREISWIFQDFPLLFLEMAHLGNKELQLWDVNTVTQLYSVALDDIHLRYLGLKNWIYWCHIGQGKGQLTYGSVMDLLDQKFYEKRIIEDDTNEEWFLSFLSGSVLVFSNQGKVEMRVFGLHYENNEDDDEDDLSEAQCLL